MMKAQLSRNDDILQSIESPASEATLEGTLTFIERCQKEMLPVIQGLRKASDVPRPIAGGINVNTSDKEI